MRLPRDISGQELAKRLARLGYRITRQTGRHIRLTCETPRQHHLTIPAHKPLRVGTLAAILSEVGVHHKISRDEVVNTLFEER